MLWWLSSIKLRILNGSQEGNRWLSSEIIFTATENLDSGFYDQEKGHQQGNRATVLC